MPRLAASVLTVEDDPITRGDLRIVLEDAGFSVFAGAKNGIEAVEFARKHEPDLILLDLGLPGLDGIEATRLILAERAVPIVALTGRSSKLAEEALGAGATSYVTKPFDEAQVIGALHDALAIHRDRAGHADRAESLRAFTHVLNVLGYPEEWAVGLERRSLARGQVWKIARTVD